MVDFRGEIAGVAELTWGQLKIWDRKAVEAFVREMESVVVEAALDGTVTSGVKLPPVVA